MRCITSGFGRGKESSSRSARAAVVWGLLEGDALGGVVPAEAMNTISGQKDFTILPWDTNLFGFPVARLHAECIASERLDIAIAEMKDAGVQLAYANTPWADVSGRERMENAGATLVDRRVIFEKRLSPCDPAPEGVELWPGSDSSPELDALALATGHLSRFRLDPRIPDGVYDKLYLAWMHRSLRREIAAAVLVVREGDELAGMITVSDDRDPATFGLGAVAPKFRGRGIGRRLVMGAEAFSAARGGTWVKPVVQAENVAMCTIYVSRGYKQTEEQAMYHLWIS